MAENEKLAPEMNAEPIENGAGMSELCPLSDYVGKPTEMVIAALEARPDFAKFANLMIKNVTFPDDVCDKNSPNYRKTTLVVNKDVPMYLTDNATGMRELRESANIFANGISIAAVLKAKGEANLADLILKNPRFALQLLAGSRISIIGHEFAAGEIMQNPFSTKISDDDRVAEKDNIQYYLVDITLSKGALLLKDKIENIMIERMLNDNI